MRHFFTLIMNSNNETPTERPTAEAIPAIDANSTDAEVNDAEAAARRIMDAAEHAWKSSPGRTDTQKEEKKKLRKAYDKARKAWRPLLLAKDRNRRAAEAVARPLYAVVPPKKKPSQQVDANRPFFDRSDYVKVTEDMSPGNNRPAGYGYVQAVRGAGASTVVDVKLESIYGGGVHKNIPLSDVHLSHPGMHLDGGAVASSRPKRKATTPPLPADEAAEIDTGGTVVPTSLIGILEVGARHGKAKGWLRRQYKLSNCQKKKLNFDEKTQLLMDIALMRQYLGEGEKGLRQQERKRDKKTKQFVPRTTKHNAHTLAYLCEEAWGLAPNRRKRLEDEVRKEAKNRGVDGTMLSMALVVLRPKDDAPKPTPTTVITDHELAEKVYTAKNLYVQHTLSFHDRLPLLGVFEATSVTSVVFDSSDGFASGFLPRKTPNPRFTFWVRRTS